MRCRLRGALKRVTPRFARAARAFSKRAGGEGPLLPDFLNAGDTLSSELPAQMPRAEASTAAPSFSEEAPTAAKEKQIVAASMQPAEALSPLKTLPDPRRPMPSQNWARIGSVEVMKILNTLAEDRPQDQVNTELADEADAVDVPEGALLHLKETQQTRVWDFRRLVLRVEPDHRHKIQVMMCKKILNDCLVTLRALQGQNHRDEPLWRFEGRRAYRLIFASVGDLVRFLAFKHLHIRHGPLRRALIPGPSLTLGQMQDLQDEWRRLLPWFRRSVGRVPEEVLLRKFLDGQLTWNLVLKLLKVDLSIGPGDQVDRG